MVNDDDSELLNNFSSEYDLIIVVVGLNDVPNGDTVQGVERLARGVEDMRAIAPHVQIVVCAIPEVLGRNGGHEQEHNNC